MNTSNERKQHLRTALINIQTDLTAAEHRVAQLELEQQATQYAYLESLLPREDCVGDKIRVEFDDGTVIIGKVTSVNHGYDVNKYASITLQTRFDRAYVEIDHTITSIALVK